MNQQVNNLIMNADENMGQVERSPMDEQLFRKQRLAAALRIFGRFGFDEGVAGHITVRDPLDPETFWVNPMGRSFKMMRVSDLIRVDHDGNIVEGSGILNGAAFTIHSQIHAARPDVTAAAHAHSIYGKAWASLGRLWIRSPRMPAHSMVITRSWMTTPVLSLIWMRANDSLRPWVIRKRLS